ncbi:ATPase domain-containing protein [Azospirillum sp.]|uniref:ATPase domain-containing protein n=1 Tax=Azospirillum sp. TaxID=34012 RepID=UPI002D676DB3|nr:ATPase domain-containing protein [Azospirillum sp.]HYD71259.1 ATPase domain-containing protein [Azospirillum sp.]
MTEETEDPHRMELDRVPTGIAGLDTVLHGGLLKGAVYIVQGVPGAGKTILSNQMCFSHVAAGGRAVYVTLLAESHTRMIQHLRPMAFFDESVIPERLYYVSAFRTLEDEGLKGLLDLLRREMRGHRAGVMVLDGLVAAEETAASDREFKKFVHEVQMHAALNGCTVLLLTTGGPGPVRAEHTMVDGLIELDDQLFEVRTERSLQVRKFRGSDSLRGRHPVRITADGLVVYPRIEAVFSTPSVPDAATADRVATGVDGLDALIGGGLIEATTTALMGPTGVGKTTFGLHFLAQCSAAEPGLLFGFYETPARLRLKAARLGLDLEGLEKTGALEIVWQAQTENVLDELAHRMRDAVLRRGVRRLFVDGLGGFIESAVHPERMSRFFSVLSNEIRALGVTAIYTLETRDILGPTLQVPVSGISSLVESVVFLRYVEVQARTRRLLSIAKIRDSGFDPALHEFEITGQGVRIVGPFAGYEGMLSGYARTLDAPAPASPSKRPPRQG